MMTMMMMEPKEERVCLYIYDLSNGLARTMSRSLIGTQIDAIWHTSVVVYDMEIYYGRGIHQCIPGHSSVGAPIEIVEMGTTYLLQGDFEAYLNEISITLYRHDNYHLLDRNCNHFSADVIEFLTGATIPPYITSLPSDVLSTPFGQMIRPFLERITGPSSIPHYPQAIQNEHFPRTDMKPISIMNESTINDLDSAYLSINENYTSCPPNMEGNENLSAYWKSIVLSTNIFSIKGIESKHLSLLQMLSYNHSFNPHDLRELLELFLAFNWKFLDIKSVSLMLDILCFTFNTIPSQNEILIDYNSKYLERISFVASDALSNFKLNQGLIGKLLFLLFKIIMYTHFETLPKDPICQLIALCIELICLIPDDSRTGLFLKFLHALLLKMETLSSLPNTVIDSLSDLFLTMETLATKENIQSQNKRLCISCSFAHLVQILHNNVANIDEFFLLKGISLDHSSNEFLKDFNKAAKSSCKNENI